MYSNRIRDFFGLLFRFFQFFFSDLRIYVHRLRDDGLLIAGHSESFYHAEEFFKLRSKTVYELAKKTGVQAGSGKR